MGSTGGAKKKRARIEIQPIFNPISYEKPTYQTAGKRVSLHGGKKIGPNRHQGRFNPIFYENQLYVFQILCQSLPFAFKSLLVLLKRLFSIFTFSEITYNQLQVFWLQVAWNWLWTTIICRYNNCCGVRQPAIR